MSARSIDSNHRSLFHNAPGQSTSQLDAGPSNASPPYLPSSTDSEASRAAGDERLAKEYAAQLMSGSRLRVPPESTLGRWLEALKSAFDSPLLKRLLETGDVTAIDIDPVKGEIRVSYNGTVVGQTASLFDIPGGLELFDSLMSAAQALTPNGLLRLPAYFKDDTVALSDVQKFYGEPVHLTEEQKLARSKELASRPVFQGQGALPHNDVRVGVLRGIGNAHMWDNLLTALKAQVEKTSASLDFDAVSVSVAPHSDAWSKQQQQPATISLKQLMIDLGLNVPTTRDELINLQNSLSAPALVAPLEGDFGGLLSKDVPLGESDQKKLTEAVDAWKALQTQLSPDQKGHVPSLLEYLQRAVPAHLRARADKDPEAFLQVLISTPQARALGRQLQEAIDAAVTETSAQEALLAALGLDADPAAGLQRNNLAGYNLRQQDNWGRSPAEIVRRFEKHLETRFGPQLAKVAAYQLLAMSAPEFLVKDVPSSLVYGSQQWASFSVAVLRREQDTPGSSAGQTYAEIMQRDALGPVTETEESQLRFAAMRSVIDWGIANGVIEERNDEAYSPEIIDRAAKALESQVNGLVSTAKLLDARTPTRRDMAMAELKRVYGADKEHLFKAPIFSDGFLKHGRKHYSLLDIYMSGELGKYYWESSDSNLSTVTAHQGFSKLSNINTAFDRVFDQQVDRLEIAVGGLFEYSFSQLPFKERQMLEHGKVTTFHLDPAVQKYGPNKRDHPLFKFMNEGVVLIRAELDGKVCHYLYSPALGQIIPDGDPSKPGLKGASDSLLFSMPRAGRPGEYEKPIRIHWPKKRPQVPTSINTELFAYPVYPSSTLATQTVGPHPMTRADVPSRRVRELAGVIKNYYGRGLKQAKEAAKGESEQERETRKKQAALDFVLGLIPFYSSIQAFIKGKPEEGLFYAFLDFFSLLLPAIKGGAVGVKAGAKGLSASLGFAKGFAKTGLTAANPLSGLFDIGRGVFKLGKAGLKQWRHSQSTILGTLRHARGRSGSFNIPKLGKKEPIAEGIYRPQGANTEPVPSLAVQRNGKWYAWDSKTQVAYGAPLQGFTPNVGQAVKETVSNVAADAAVDATTNEVSKGNRPTQSSLPGSQYQAELERKINADGTHRNTQATLAAWAQALRSQVQQANKDLVALIGVGAQDVEIASADGSTGIHVRLDQMDAALEKLEDLIRDNQRRFKVYFQRHIPVPINPQDTNAVRDRLSAIEKRLEVVKTALRSMEAYSRSAA